MKAAITGATGFLGTYLCYYLLKGGHSVVALKRGTSDLSLPSKIFDHLNALEGNQIDFNSINWIKGDVLDPHLLEAFVSEVDICFHTAAIVSFDKKLTQKMTHVNVEGTANVVNACCNQNVEKLMMCSSVAALTNVDGQANLDETFHNSTYYRFETPYGESKYRAEMEAWRGIGEGMKVLTVNPSVILGAWKFEDSSVQMFKTVNDGMPFYPTGQGNFVDVRDVAEIMISISQKDELNGERFLLSGGNLSFKVFLSQIADNLGVKKPSIKAGKNLSVFVARINQLIAHITGKPAALTPNMARAANRKSSYNTSKVQLAIGTKFRPLNETIKWTADYFKLSQK